MCTCEQLTGTSARYACSEEHDHECKPSPHRHTSASTSGEKAGKATRADCGSTGDRTGCARSKGAANLFTIPPDDERETASSGALARECLSPVAAFTRRRHCLSAVWFGRASYHPSHAECRCKLIALGISQAAVWSGPDERSAQGSTSGRDWRSNTVTGHLRSCLFRPRPGSTAQTHAATM